MATVLGGGRVQLNNGKIVNAEKGGWYDGQQFWDNSLSSAGVINSKSDQVGAGQPVSQEVNRQTSVAAGLAPDANQNFINKQNGSAGGGIPGGAGFSNAGAIGGGGAGFSTPETLNLPKLYEQMYASSGIKDLEGEYSTKEKEFIEAKGRINDDPFLSESSRLGRVAKLESLFGERTANLKNDIATRKADIETKLNLETKQFDINSQVAQQSLSQFNTLLQMGALDGASGDDIANLTRSTGLSSQAIASAVAANKRKNAQTQVITSTNDAGEVTAIVMDTQTGEIISKNSLGRIGNAENGGSAKVSQEEQKSYYANSLRTDAQKGLTLSQVFSLYTGYLEPDLIYQLYNSNSKYGADKGDIENLAKYGVTQPKD